MVTQYRPLLSIEGSFFHRINWKWVLQRVPMLLFAIVSSYGVGYFLYQSGLPIIFATFGSISFDLGFLGVIAIADQQLKKSRASMIIYYILNVSLAGLAALFNVLSHADGLYANITAEDITAGAPFALVGLVFALFYHEMMRSYIDAEMKAEQQLKERQEKELAILLAREQYIIDNPYQCICEERFKKKIGLRNHQRTCKTYGEQMKIK